MVARQDRGRAFTGTALLLGVGAIHVIAFPDHYEVAAYIGGLFILLAAATVVLAIGIGARIRFAWSLAALLFAVSIVLYVVARTSGLPYYHETNWLDPMGSVPLGLLSVILEGLFVFLYLKWRPDSDQLSYRRPAFF